MKVDLTRTKAIVLVCLLALLAGGVMVKHFWFPSVADQYFLPDYQQLQHAPGGLFILRSTHYSRSSRQGCAIAWTLYGPNDMRPRFVGRNVTIGQILAVVHQCPPWRLVLPTDMPVKRYDMLVTVRENSVQQLEAKLKNKFGYVVSWQMSETVLWQLKVIPGKLPPSPAAATQEGFQNGRLNLTHVPMENLLYRLETSLEKPVKDCTGLTGYYDFSIPWEWHGTRPDQQTLKDALAKYGLYLELESDTIPMLVVTKAR
jgi:uncharacterized protein (TIGR03435 family)